MYCIAVYQLYIYTLKVGKGQHKLCSLYQIIVSHISVESVTYLIVLSNYPISTKRKQKCRIYLFQLLIFFLKIARHSCLYCQLVNSLDVQGEEHPLLYLCRDSYSSIHERTCVYVCVHMCVWESTKGFMAGQLLQTGQCSDWLTNVTALDMRIYMYNCRNVNCRGPSLMETWQLSRLLCPDSDTVDKFTQNTST